MDRLKSLRPYRYESVAFSSGGAVMVLEIVGSRLMAPVFGTSTYVWTAMIGVILGSLAVGYAFGGKLADRTNNGQSLGFILFLAAILILITGLTQSSLLASIAALSLDIRLGALLAAIVLFAPASVLVGMVSPHLAKASLTSLDTSGSTIGRLEAAGALGSIAGTFACGYFLLGAFGSRSIIIGVVVLLVIMAILLDPLIYKKIKWISLPIILLSAYIMNLNSPYVLADLDTSYARYQVVASSYGSRPANLLVTDNGGIQSGFPTDNSNAILFSYIQRFHDSAVAYQNPGRVLVIGGGAYTFPMDLIRTFPSVKVDAVEIDPALKGIARQYFGYQNSPRIQTFDADGRSYLNTNTKKYDLIYMDAFSSISPPFQLTTKQTVERIKQSLQPDGVVVVNLIGKYSGGQGDYLRSVEATYKNVFNFAATYQTDTSVPLDDDRHNYTLYASASPDKYRLITDSTGQAPLKLAPGGLLLTDNYAPIDKLLF